MSIEFPSFIPPVREAAAPAPAAPAQAANAAAAPKKAEATVKGDELVLSTAGNSAAFQEIAQAKPATNAAATDVVQQVAQAYNPRQAVENLAAQIFAQVTA